MDACALVHELQVHQIELEMQNEELQHAYVAAQEASENYYDLFDFAPVGYLLWNAEGRILAVNLAGAALLGLNRKALIETPFEQFVAEDNRPAFAEFCKQVLTTGFQQTCEIKLLCAGQVVYAVVEGIAAPNHQGQEKLCRAAVIDITQRRFLEKSLRTAHATLETARRSWPERWNNFTRKCNSELRPRPPYSASDGPFRTCYSPATTSGD